MTKQTVLGDALIDLRNAILKGQDREAAITEIAASYGLWPSLLARLVETPPPTAPPTQTPAEEKRLDDKVLALMRKTFPTISHDNFLAKMREAGVTPRTMIEAILKFREEHRKPKS